jgi:RNA polymerase sigma factor (sigma-70 family)
MVEEKESDRIKISEEELAKFISNHENYKSLYRFINMKIQHYRLSDVDPQDVFSDVVYHTLIHIRRKDNQKIQNLNAWMRVLAMRILMNTVRKEMHYKRITNKFSYDLTPENHVENNGLTEMEAVETKVKLAHALKSLSTQDQELLNYVLFQEISISEVSLIYLQSQSTMRRRISRAKKRLVEKLRENDTEFWEDRTPRPLN